METRYKLCKRPSNCFITQQTSVCGSTDKCFCTVSTSWHKLEARVLITSFSFRVSLSLTSKPYSYIHNLKSYYLRSLRYPPSSPQTVYRAIFSTHTRARMHARIHASSSTTSMGQQKHFTNNKHVRARREIERKSSHFTDHCNPNARARTL